MQSDKCEDGACLGVRIGESFLSRLPSRSENQVRLSLERLDDEGCEVLDVYWIPNLALESPLAGVDKRLQLPLDHADEAEPPSGLFASFDEECRPEAGDEA
jgi:hypothetical protein